MATIPQAGDPRPIISRLIEAVDAISAGMTSDVDGSQERQNFEAWRQYHQALSIAYSQLPPIPESLHVKVPESFRSALDVAWQQTISPSNAPFSTASQTRNIGSVLPALELGTQDTENASKHLTIDWVQDEVPLELPLSAEPIQQRLERVLATDFIRVSPAKWRGTASETRAVVLLSRIYERADGQICWYSFSRDHLTFLADSTNSFVTLCVGSGGVAFLIPFNEFSGWLPDMNMTNRDSLSYWHVILGVKDGNVCLRCNKGVQPINLSRYFLRESYYATD